MDLTIHPHKLSGTLTIPPSKSQAHRLLLAAGLSQKTCTISNLSFSEDISATLSCLSAMGIPFQQGSDCVTLSPHQSYTSKPHFDCGESGSTLRFFIPIALALCSGGSFTGRGRLMERPQTPYQILFENKGILWQQEQDILTLQGQLTSGSYSLPGDVSSQFVTGLLYALPLLNGDSELILTSALESRGYVDLTLDTLSAFGIEIEEPSTGHFKIKGNQTYQAQSQTVEGDWSQAGFWYAANFLDNQVTLQGLNTTSKQGDRQVAQHYWTLARPNTTVELDVSQCPDLVPPLALMAALRSGTTHLVNAARLRMKESDRLHTVAITLNALGGHVEEQTDSLTIQGVSHLSGGVTIDCCNDHRIAMMAAIAATACQQPITLTGAECVKKSYPNFWAHYQQLGGILDGFLLG